jgi:hypothetical protein
MKMIPPGHHARSSKFFPSGECRAGNQVKLDNLRAAAYSSELGVQGLNSVLFEAGGVSLVQHHVSGVLTY